MNTYPQFLADDLPEVSPNVAKYHIIPVPYEQTVSYGGGTANGPSAILNASLQLEALLDGCIPGKNAIFVHPPVDCSLEAEAFIKALCDKVKAVVEDEKLPIVLGGEHSISYAPIKAILDKGERFGVIQIDAHADLRNEYDGNRWSHACVMRRVHEMDVPILQLGVRSLCQEEFLYRDNDGISFVDAEQLCSMSTFEGVIPKDFPKKIYLTIDVDGLDPSIMPATGTPEPGGLLWYPLMDLLKTITTQRKVVGLDVVELAPIDSLHHCEFTVAKLIYKLISLLNARE